MVNVYINYELDTWSRGTDFTFGNCLFGAVKLTKTVDPDEYGYKVMALELMHIHNFHGKLKIS